MNWDNIKRNKVYIKVWLLIFLGNLAFSLFDPFIHRAIVACRNYVVTWWVHQDGIEAAIQGIGMASAMTCYYYWKLHQKPADAPESRERLRLSK